jgi:cyclase
MGKTQMRGIIMSLKLFRVAILVAATLSMSAAFAQAPPPQGGGAGAGAQGGGPGGAGGPGGGPGGGGRGGAQNTVQMISMLKPNLYLITGAGANSVVRVANEGLLVVNAKGLGQMNYDNLLAQIKTVSDKPVKYVVIGDVHQDKSGNTALFVGAGAQVIAQENEKAGLATYTNPAGTPGPPNMTYKTEYSIKMDGKEVAHLYHWGNASTNGDTITYFPAEKVVVMGDVIQANLLGINADYPQGGSILDWHTTLEGTLKLDFDTVIGNGGMPQTRADIEAELKRLNGISAEAIAAVKMGVTEDQLVAAVDMADPGFQVERFLANNNKARLDAFFAEASKAAGK